jgi:hypothetical protein
MSRFRAVLLACGVLWAVPAFGASPDPKDLAVPQEELSKARALVRQLGSEAYREREDAQLELTKMGRLARQALAEGAIGDADPEVRLRCSRLLPKAAADDLKARIDTFLADKEGKFDHDLPGLKVFRKSLGADDKARALYVDLLKSPYNLDLLAAVDKGQTEGGRAISDRRTMLYNDMQHRPIAPGGKPFTPKQPTLADIACLLFAETVVPSDKIPKSGTWMWVNGTMFLQQPASQQAINNASTPHADAYKVIVGQWLASRFDPMELNNLSYQLGTNLKQFKESLPLLRRIVTTDGVAGYAKGQALMHLVQQKGKEEVPFLKSLLGNDTMVQQVWFGKPNGMAEMHSCLMKDVALAFLLTQTGQNIRDYGFEFPPGVIPNPNQLGYGNYAFTSEDKRTAAFVKFGWWQLKEGMKGPAPKGKEPAKQPAKEPVKGPTPPPTVPAPPPK